MSITIFDLDHTLLDAEKLKDELASILGMSSEEFRESYENNFKNKKINYSFENHLDVLGKNDIEKAQLKKEFNNNLSDMKGFLKEGAEDLVLDEKNKDNQSSEIVLMTFGNKEWQQDKISRLPDLEKLFDKIIYEERDKEDSQYLRELAEKVERVLIVNDNIAETEKMVEILGRENCRVKIIDGPYSDKETARRLGYEFYENLGSISREKNKYLDEIKLTGKLR